MSFVLPEIHDSPLGFGPSDGGLNQFKEVPFAPFSKSEKLGKAADWTSTTRQFQTSRNAPTAANIFQIAEEQEDEEEFHLVDSRPTGQRKNFANRFRAARGGRFRGQQQGGRYQNTRQGYGNNQNQGRNFQQRGGHHHQRTYGAHRGNYYGGGNRRYYQDRNRRLEPSVTVEAEWGDPIETFEFNHLAKLKGAKFGEGETLIEAGSLEYFNNAYAAIKNEKTLEKNWAQDRAFFKVTSSDDPHLRKLAEQGEADIFTTDVILSVLMTANKTVFPWDIVITKRDGQIFLDKRGNRLDLLSVNENSGEQFDQNEESINSMGKLCQEATVINQNFSQQVLSHTNDGNYDFEEPNPFAADGSAVASSGYKYRRFDLDSDLSLICRCEIDAIKIAKDGSQQFIHTRALNEYDPKLTGDWRKNLERRGGVIANELKNNASKMARWTAAAVLAGVQSLELGFVSRVAPRDNMNHVILATQSTKPSEISSQMSLNFDNMWSIVRTLINSVFNHPSDGKFLLLKDSTAANLKLYKIPDNAFAEDLSGDSAAQGGQLILK